MGSIPVISAKGFIVTTTLKTMESIYAGIVPGETRAIMRGHDRMCHGMVIDQDGAMFACKYAHENLKCPECEGLFCGLHSEIKEGLFHNHCTDCLGGDAPLKEDY